MDSLHNEVFGQVDKYIYIYIFRDSRETDHPDRSDAKIFREKTQQQKESSAEEFERRMHSANNP